MLFFSAMTHIAGKPVYSTKPESASEGSHIDFFDRLQLLTEKCLTYRKRARRIKREKQKKKNVFLDWVGAFLWAVGMVLLINQYLFQAYQIPSGSMIDTLLIGDHIFVNKFIYGPELLPGLGKLPSPIKPRRNEIVIFENPSYISRGTVFDIAKRVIYTLTLTMVDIDRDERGEPKAHFLIKRAAGVGGDRFIQEQGNMRIRPAGESRWFNEAGLCAAQGMSHNISRLMPERDYPALEAAGKAAAFRDLGLIVPPELQRLALQAGSIANPDYMAHEKARLELLRGAYPQESRYSVLLARHNQGLYVPETRILTLGDNRDNSRDGRHFGPVQSSKILGRASIIYIPGDFRYRRFAALERFGSIR